MTVNRRFLVGTSLALGAMLPTTAGAAGPRAKDDAAAPRTSAALAAAIAPNAGRDQSKELQAAIDHAAERGVTLTLAPGRYLVQGLKLRAGSHIRGTPGRTILAHAAPGTLITGELADRARLEGLVIEGGAHALQASDHAGLVHLHRSRNVVLADLELRGSRVNGIVLTGCSGSIRDCDIAGSAQAGIVSVDAVGLEITNNTVTDCANNGILVWRTTVGEDGTIVSSNRIERIRAEAGGSGQNGNGVNVYRAGSVLVTGNRIADCAYSAIRGNAASNIQMTGNSCARLGEVALYAEFGFEGALISSNIVDGAATGISVTNFNEGGRLAVVQGNLIRNIVRREHEPEDKRGDGIAVEADTVVTGNTIENAATVGISIGWGQYMREVVATSNVIRKSRVGIMITRDPGAGAALIAQNMISGTRDGAIRAMDKGVAIGPELVRGGTQSSRITIAGNVATDAGA